MTVETLPDRKPSLLLPRRGGVHFESDGIIMDLHPPGTCEYYFISPKEAIGFPVGRRPTRVVRAFDSDVLKTEYVLPDTMGFVFRGSRIYGRVCENQEDTGALMVMGYDPELRYAIEQEMPNRTIRLRADHNLPISPSTKILFQSILRFMNNGFQGGKMAAESLVSMAIMRVLEIFGEDSRKKNLAVFALKKRALDRTLEYIEANLNRDIGLREIGDTAEVGLCHIEQSFKNAVGAHPCAYLTQRRVECAKDLLANTSKPMSEIAQTCGFSSQSHLSTTFKRSTGVTPSHYRLATRQ